MRLPSVSTRYFSRFKPICLLVGLVCPGVWAQPQPLFRLLPASQTNVSFRNDIDDRENLNILAYEYFYNGGGVAVGDFNNDGLQDLFLTANLGANKLYLNTGNLTFKDITRSASPELEGREGGWKTGVSVADVNQDGWLDIYICYSGKVPTDVRRNQLFINQKNLTFKEQAKAYGLDDPGYSTQAAFLDYDRDGDLDLLLLNHNVQKFDNMELAKYHNEIDELAGNKLYENQKGRFINVTMKAGLHQYPLTFGLGMAVADINQDGWPDIYVTNDYNEPDYLYINQKNGTFKDETTSSFRHLSQFSMGVDVADYNNDGLPDVLSLDMLPEDNRRQKLLQLQENYESFELMQRQGLQRQYMRNMLQLNNGNDRNGIPTFSEIGQLAGVSNTDWSWSPLLADFDNDGYKDLFITNGYLRDYTNKDFLRYWGDYKIKKAIAQEPVQLMDLVRAMPSTKIPNYIFRNNHDLTFANKQLDWGMQMPTVSNGAAYADLDNDGDLELIINNINEVASVYQNLSREQAQTNYIQLQVGGRAAGKSLLGTRVSVYTGAQQQYQECYPVRGYLSSQSPVMHFGLGEHSRIDSIKIIWPDQSVQLLTNVAANQLLTLEPNPGKGTTVATTKPLKSATIFTPATVGLPYAPESLPENDFKRQPLMLWMYSHAGPVMAKGDVNKDGLADLYISGDQQKPGGLFLQQKDGSFRKNETVALGNEATSVIAGAVFFDANGDGFDDLYLAKGGYAQAETNTASLQDELYLNDRNGKLVLDKQALPNVQGSSKSCVRPVDVDGDGDLDLFVGGRVVPGRYPEAPQSYLLENTGKGQFKSVPVPFATVGMVTDAQWTDLNNDNRPDLILTGEFMSIRVYHNTKEGFMDVSRQYFPEPDYGLWLSLTLADLNGDGQKDLIVGNLGRNTQIKASRTEPADLVFADFDKNGSIDPFFCFYVQGVAYPFVSRDELNDQMYAMRKKFAFYKDYANATLSTMFSESDLASAGKLSVTETNSVIYWRKDGQFVKQVLPLQAQFAPVTQSLADDFNMDGRPDILLLGNKSDNRLKLGSVDASYGCLLLGDGKGGFVYETQPVSGLSVVGDVKSVVQVPLTKNRQPVLLIGAYNQPIQVYKVRKE